MLLKGLCLLLLSHLSAGAAVVTNSSWTADPANSTSLVDSLDPTNLNETDFVPHSELRTKGPKYRDNHVEWLVQPESWNIDWRYFKVTEFTVTGGQDPEQRNHVGDIHHFENKNDIPRLSFSVGRYKSLATAGWWNREFDQSQMTFHHNAKHLNFAFIGDIHATLFDGFQHKDFIIPQVGFAQGRWLFSNNWWFAGKKATWIGHGSVIIKPVGVDLCFRFVRGDRGDLTDRHYRVRVFPLHTCEEALATRCTDGKC